MAETILDRPSSVNEPQVSLQRIQGGVWGVQRALIQGLDRGCRPTGPRGNPTVGPLVLEILTSWGFLFGTLVLVVAFVLELLRQVGALPEGGLSELASLYVGLTLPPLSLIVWIMVGFLAPPAPFITGALLGVLDAALITVLVLLFGQDGETTAAFDALAPVWLIALLVASITTGLIGLLVRRMFLRRSDPHPGSDAASATATLEAIALARTPVLVRTYRGDSQADTDATFRVEAEVLGRHGYVPTSQSWSPGQWGCSAFVVAVLLFWLLIGILILFYLLIVKPEGTLTVTYELRSGVADMPQAGTRPPQGSVADHSLARRLADLDEARRAGLLTDDEYAEKRREILGTF